MEQKIKRFDCIVVGGGCIGCATALRVADRGFSVALLERDTLNGFSSAAAVGGLNYLSDDLGGTSLIEFTSSCADGFKDYLLGLTDRTSQKIAYFEDDLLQVAFSPAEMSKLDSGLGHLSSQVELRDRFERLSAPDLLKLAPYLSEDIFGGYRLEEPQVEVPELLSALDKAVRSHSKISVFEGIEVQRIVDSRTSVEVVGTSGTSDVFSAGTAVLAAGVLSPTVLGLENQISMKPVKGQAFRMTGGDAIETYQGRPFPFHVYSHPENDEDDFGRIYGSYIVPRANGEVVAGVTYEENSGFDDTVHKQVEQRMLQINERVVPSLATMRVIGSWTGHRPLLERCGARSPNELCLPVVGRLYANSNIVVATGHLGLGITMSDGTAELVERLLLDECTDADLRALEAMHPRLQRPDELEMVR